jgi:N-acetylmuramoyl-L-alanine amidase CwlD
VRTIRLTIAAAIAASCILARPGRADAAAYVRLSEIAERYGLRAESDFFSGRQVLGDGTNRLAVVPGGYQILVNGKFAFLRERVAWDDGEVIVPAAALPFIEANLVRTARPAEVSAPPPVPAAAAPEASARVAPALPRGSAGTIVLDPGHGGIYTGARGRSGIYEKDVNLSIAKHAAALLEDRGWRVILTRAGDRQLADDLHADLDARVALANSSSADLFISIHTNYAENPSVSGFEVFYFAPSRRSGALAREIARSLRAAIPDEERGVKTANFRVIKRSRVPAVLVEVGFVSHGPTERRLATDEYRRTLAEAIVRGIERYSRLR